MRLSAAAVVTAVALHLAVLTRAAGCFDRCRFTFCPNHPGSFNVGAANDVPFTTNICDSTGAVTVGHVDESGEAYVVEPARNTRISQWRPNGLLQPFAPSFFKSLGLNASLYDGRDLSGIGHQTPQRNQADFLNGRCFAVPLRAYQVLNDSTGHVTDNIHPRQPLVDCVSFRASLSAQMADKMNKEPKEDTASNETPKDDAPRDNPAAENDTAPAELPQPEAPVASATEPAPVEKPAPKAPAAPVTKPAPVTKAAPKAPAATPAPVTKPAPKAPAATPAPKVTSKPSQDTAPVRDDDDAFGDEDPLSDEISSFEDDKKTVASQAPATRPAPVTQDYKPPATMKPPALAQLKALKCKDGCPAKTALKPMYADCVKQLAGRAADDYWVFAAAGGASAVGKSCGTADKSGNQLCVGKLTAAEWCGSGFGCDGAEAYRPQLVKCVSAEGKICKLSSVQRQHMILEKIEGGSDFFVSCKH